LFIYFFSAHHAVIFAIAQLSRYCEENIGYCTSRDEGEENEHCNVTNVDDVFIKKRARMFDMQTSTAIEGTNLSERGQRRRQRVDQYTTEDRR